jgi:signal peptidase I
MRPTLEPGDTIFVLKAPIGFDRKVARGDVVIFESPLEPGKDYIKRVLGVAGDTVRVQKGHFTLDGKSIEAPASRAGAPCGKETLPGGRAYEVCWESPLPEDFGPERVPENSVFVLGDFRNQGTADSKKRKSWGIVPIPAIKGKAQWIWLSIEPHNSGISPVHFPSFRFDRMFRRLDSW